MATKFVIKNLLIAMPDKSEFVFWFDGNGKITGTQGSFANPVANAFSLVRIQDCPFATSTCKSTCYVRALEKMQKKIYQKYQSNSQEIKKILTNPIYQKITELAFANWIQANNLQEFRWHVSGDIFSMEYARFIRSVCDLAPEVRFIIYTRSFAYLKPLQGAANLTVNLSADKDNWLSALKAHYQFGLRLCYLTIEGELPSELPEGSVIFPSYETRGRDLKNPTQSPWWQSLTPQQKRMVCPPDFFGQSEKFRCGPCKKCLKPR